MTDALNQELDKVKAMQLTIDKMLQRGSLALKRADDSGASIANKWVLEPIYQGDDCSIGFVHIANIQLGECEQHLHKNCREYLVVVKGCILLNVEGRDIRVVREGECCAIESGILHYSKPLVNDTKLAYICVPRDKNIPESQTKEFK